MLEPIWPWFQDAGNQKLILAVFIAFSLGLVIGKWRRRGSKEKGIPKSRNADEAFFMGIQYMLSDDPDSAIEQLTKSVQINSDTIETYIALGNLYRSKGDIDRAIRIRQSIILRPKIDDSIRLRALFDLGLDFRKGGFLNRALETFQRVLNQNPKHLETLEQIERIYEELNDWENAYETRQKISKLAKGDHEHILAHQLVEAGKKHWQGGDMRKALSQFGRAISTDPACIDAYLNMSDIFFTKKDFKKAISALEEVVKQKPEFTFLAHDRLDKAYPAVGTLKPLEDFLRECVHSNGDAFTHTALAKYLSSTGDVEGALREVDLALDENSHFREARKLKASLLLAHGREKEALEDYRSLVEMENTADVEFQCTQCGYEPSNLEWQCPRCKKWDTISRVTHYGAD